MQWSLFVLVLTGQCCFSTCRLYEYHFIAENKTWDEAQTYCRDKYTDLATVYDETDMERLRRLLNPAQHTDPAWIGLYREDGANRMWHWSLPGVEFNETQWYPKEPNDKNASENCVQIQSDKLWRDDKCDTKHGFICYDAMYKSINKFPLHTDKKNWQEAQKYCRDNHTDLISGVHQLEDFNKTDISFSGNVWIGLFRDRWRWSDESNSSFRDWNLDKFRGNDKNCATIESDTARKMTLDSSVEEGSDKKCVSIMLRRAGGGMHCHECHKKKPFFCYDDKVILIKQKKTWVEALNYCRENHHDLASITNCYEQSWVQKRAEKAKTAYVWMGLRYTCTLDLWFWVSDNLVSYKNLEFNEMIHGCNMCGAMNKGGKWLSQDENEKLNFVCIKKEP